MRLTHCPTSSEWVSGLAAGFIALDVCAGAVINEGEEEQETAFRFAIERINDDATVLPGVTLVAHVERVLEGDSFGTEKKSESSIEGCTAASPSSRAQSAVC